MKPKITFLIFILAIGMAQAQTHFSAVGDFANWEAWMPINILEAMVSGSI